MLKFVWSVILILAISGPYLEKTASVSEAPFRKGAHPCLNSRISRRHLQPPARSTPKRRSKTSASHAAKGDFITVIGANGAGKSTLFNAISGSFFTDSGKIKLDGKDITFMPESISVPAASSRLFRIPCAAAHRA